MGRARRRASESGLYHVTCRGVGRQIIFEDDLDRQFFCDKLFEETGGLDIQVLAWCLMDNHIHLLLEADPEPLATLMRHVLATYAMRFNKRYNRVGHVFQGRYSSLPIENERHLLSVVKYIHRNPCDLGGKHLQDYRWSSYREYLGETGRTNTAFVLDLFDSSIAEFVRFNEETDEAAAGSLGTEDGIGSLDRAFFAAADELGEDLLRSVKTLPRAERDACVGRLLDRGLSIRQIERLTGVSRGIVAKISKLRKS